MDRSSMKFLNKWDGVGDEDEWTWKEFPDTVNGCVRHYYPPHWHHHRKNYIHENDQGQFFICRGSMTNVLAGCDELENAQAVCLLLE